MKSGSRPKPAPEQPTLAKGTEARVPTAADSLTRPRWTGCPMGCASWHDHPSLSLHRCNYCTCLDHAARDSLHDCSGVCPMVAVA
jgi:hypothetical protein